MKSLASAFDWALNGTLFIVAVLTVVVLVRGGLLVPNHRADSTVHVGSAIVLPGTDWAENRATLVVALQIGCRWCEASASFYRDLLRSNTGGTFHIVAVLPSTPSEDQKYLEQLKVNFLDVRQADLSGLGITATPTLLLVGPKGTVQSSWEGMLSPELESEVFHKLGVERARPESNASTDSDPAIDETPANAGLITAAQFAGLQKRSGQVSIVDIRPRPEFAGSHIVGSLNIPTDELEERAVNELPKSRKVVIYCHYCPPCESQRSHDGELTYCTVSRYLLRKSGFSDVRILNVDLSQLQAAGTKIEGLAKEPFNAGSSPVQVAQ